MTAPSAIRAHVSPGRLRIRIRERGGDTAFFRKVEEALSSLPEVREVETNPRTGSVLVSHSTEPEAIEAFGRERALFEVSTAPRLRVAPRRRLETGVKSLVQNEAQRGWVRLETVGVVALLGAAIYQVRRGILLPPAQALLEQALRLSTVIMRARR